MKMTVSKEYINRERERISELDGELSVIRKYGRYMFRYSDYEIEEKAHDLIRKINHSEAAVNELQEQYDYELMQALEKKRTQIDFELNTEQWRNSPMPTYDTTLGGDQLKLDV